MTSDSAMKTFSRPLHILAVDDNAINQHYLRALLSKHGHSPTIAANGLEALEKLAHEKFDLVLMDIQMPVMDGLTATNHIRQGEFNVKQPDIPVIALSAHTKTASDTEKTPFTNWLIKPLEVDSLLKILQQTIETS